MEDRVKPDEPHPIDRSAVEALLAHVPWPEGDAGLDDETLAAWAEGALSDAERDAVEARLAQWSEGRTWMSAVQASRDLDEPAVAARTAPAPSRRAAWLPLAAAAMLVAAFGVALAMGGFDRPAEPTLAQTVASLRADHPDLFGDFTLLDETFLSARRETERGGLVANKPHHTISATRPRFTWSQRDGIEQFDVTLYDAEGRTIWTRQVEQAELDYPDDEQQLTPGTSYVWEVAGDAGLGALTSRRKFDTWTAPMRERFGDALNTVRRSGAPDTQQNLVLAHFAIRLGLLQKAEDVVSADALSIGGPANPLEPLVQQVLEYVAGQ